MIHRDYRDFYYRDYPFTAEGHADAYVSAIRIDAIRKLVMAELFDDGARAHSSEARARLWRGFGHDETARMDIRIAYAVRLSLEFEAERDGRPGWFKELTVPYLMIYVPERDVAFVVDVVGMRAAWDELVRRFGLVVERRARDVDGHLEPFTWHLLRVPIQVLRDEQLIVLTKRGVSLLLATSRP